MKRKTEEWFYVSLAVLRKTYFRCNNWKQKNCAKKSLKKKTYLWKDKLSEASRKLVLLAMVCFLLCEPRLYQGFILLMFKSGSARGGGGGGGLVVYQYTQKIPENIHNFPKYTKNCKECSILRS